MPIAGIVNYGDADSYYEGNKILFKNSRFRTGPNR